MGTGMKDEFEEAYECWLNDCLKEYNERYHENRTLYNYLCDSETSVEFSQTGDAYPHGIGGIGWIPTAVTPWKDSVHYVK